MQVNLLLMLINSAFHFYMEELTKVTHYFNSYKSNVYNTFVKKGICKLWNDEDTTAIVGHKGVFECRITLRLM